MIAVVVALALAAASGGGNPHLARAKSLYDKFKYGQALDKLNDALAWPGTSKAEKAEIYVYIGMSRLQGGDDKGAEAAFREALTVDTAAALPKQTSPKIQRVFDRVKAEVVVVPPERDVPVVVAPPPPVVVAPKVEPVAPAPVETKPVFVEKPVEAAKEHTRWPVFVAAGAAAAMVGAGALMGMQAKNTELAANRAEWIDERERLSSEAQGQATAANGLFIGAGATAVLGVVFVVAL